MTRENKLALVVGFGLILLVGILVSDHFSPARTEAAADLDDPARSDDGRRVLRPEELKLVQTEAMGPAADRRRPRPDRGDARGGTRTTPVDDRTALRDPNPPRFDDADDASIGRGGRLPEDADDGPGEIEMGGASQRSAGDGRERFAPGTRYRIRRGDSLHAICSEHYGDASLAVALARFNGLEDPSQIRENEELLLPPAGALGGDWGDADRDAWQRRDAGERAGASNEDRDRDRDRGNRNTDAGGPRTYVVKRGDVLSIIAQRELGSARHAQAIFQLNRDQLDDPDDIREGMRLKLPAS